MKVHLHVYTTWRCILNEKSLASIAWAAFCFILFLTLVKATASPPATIAFYRVFIATLVVTPFGLKISLVATQFFLPLIVATLGLTLDFVLWFYLTCFTTVAHATFIVNMAPLGGCDEHRVL